MRCIWRDGLGLCCRSFRPIRRGLLRILGCLDWDVSVWRTEDGLDIMNGDKPSKVGFEAISLLGVGKDRIEATVYYAVHGSTFSGELDSLCTSDPLSIYMHDPIAAPYKYSVLRAIKHWDA